MEKYPNKPAKYVFVDVVEFTRPERSTDDQWHIMRRLNESLSRSLSQLNIPENRRIFLPAGDAICIAFVSLPDNSDDTSDFNWHAELAKAILSHVSELNEGVSERQRFEIRIGLNEANTEILYEDPIDHRWGIAGDGINRAQRVMSLADGNQIIVAKSVWRTLHRRDGYVGFFDGPYEADIKHSERIVVYQYRPEGVDGVNGDPPSKLVGKETGA